MSDSTRPSVQSVQRSLLIGALVGLILGVVVGLGLAALYIRQNPPVYTGGAYPSELTNAYQNHYTAMAVDSYIVNQQPDVAQERLKTFNARPQITALAERSAAYVAAGRATEAQLVNNLAVTLKSANGWSDDVIKTVVGDLSSQYQNDPARAQAVSTFSAALLEGQVPIPSADATAAPADQAAPTDQQQPAPADQPTDQQAQPADQPAQPEAPAQAQPPPPPLAAEGGLTAWLPYILCCVLLLVIGLIIYAVGRRQFESRRAPTKQKIDWEGEGKPPLKQWSGTYTLGQDMYDEFFTIETDSDDFLGECGMGILEALPNTSPKQVVAFDVGLFDKTDITTLSRALMSEHAYNDEAIRSKIDINPQAEAVLAEPGKEFSFETSALRVEAKIDEMEYGEGSNVYFEKLKVTLNLFLKEGADLKKGKMDIPDEYQ